MFHPERAVPETGVMRQRFWGNCFLFENLHVFVVGQGLIM